MNARQSSTTSCHSRSDSNLRKRVSKACDRCRLKKSKCDGTTPCGRCRADNSICVFGERKRAPNHGRLYPKGYVEMLEQQQTWLVYGLQKLYQLSSEGERPQNNLVKCRQDGHPLTHDLLTQLGVLDHMKENYFEENTEALQQKLWEQSAGRFQNLDLSNRGSKSAQTPPTDSCFGDASIPSKLPPMPPSFISQASTIKPEPQILPQNPLYVAPLWIQGAVSPITSHGRSQLSNSGFDAFDEICRMEPSNITNHQFDDPMLSPVFYCQIPASYMTMPSFMDAKSEHDDFYQYLDLNSAASPI
ncbi:hypothetical protein BDV24DRAFT_156962 [Aspergillus arachidicola]|uniref:Zn(II)2Cys6 transcription factor n=1 Tax=Aspergillus arachidicola TaxID=656916 RepID=A0A2G7EL80_9EURO|nr:hypothetical protein BDV24DRAFT_156962 [Aspergillus arachidicola]PIG69059.1 Zn(II)2Cys6 transcription factor [Aspergillus arachidicola]